MNWQQCPKCYGQGVVWFPPNQPMRDTYISSGVPFTCDVCNGKKIINEFGLPPETLPHGIETHPEATKQ